MAAPTAIGTSARAEVSPKGRIAIRITCSRSHPIYLPRNRTGASTCSTWRATRSSATAAKNCTPMICTRCGAYFRQYRLHHRQDHRRVYAEGRQGRRDHGGGVQDHDDRVTDGGWDAIRPWLPFTVLCDRC